jgi:hypothetical protein
VWLEEGDVFLVLLVEIRRKRVIVTDRERGAETARSVDAYAIMSWRVAYLC